MTAQSIQIDNEKCRKDGICVNICPVGIFKGNIGEIPSVDEALATACIKCGHCSAACPTAAISIEGLAADKYQPYPAKIPSLPELRSLVLSRRSIREFKDEPVDLDLVKEILDLTRFCPTAKNTQLLRWVLVNGKEKVHEISAAVIDTFRSNEKMAPMVQAFDNGLDPINRGAPQLLLVCGPARYDWGPLDGAIYIANFELAAKAAGLGTCWAGFTTRGAAQASLVSEKIGLSNEEKVFGAFMLGYPKYDYCRVPPRKPVSLKIISN
ncbi:MAG: nitroreductase [Candidatus Riflebacteria bacterium HGW-Riflebacteria-2]|jgi:nitroreductase/NAD-dependent dihydropyrimidine dehydrogenase PreA subunit|nr:MAG: nitroreductase [Candidatus Riflebacteria bacterium HGW-Riflebacteria-2]